MADQRIESAASRPEEYSLVADVGEVASEEGMTRVVLEGTGRFVVEEHREQGGDEQRRDEQQRAERGDARGRRYDGELGAERARSLLAQAARFGWDRHFPPRPGIPDEAIVRWTLRDASGEVATVRAWLRDAEKDPAMAPVLSALREAVQRATDGALYL